MDGALGAEISIVIVEDNEVDLRRYRRALKRIEFQTNTIEFESCAAAKTYLKENAPDLIILDQVLTDGLGIDLAMEIGSYPHLRDTDLAMVSGQDCFILADHLMHSPCHTLISKDELNDDLLVEIIGRRRLRGVVAAEPAPSRLVQMDEREVISLS